MADNDQIVIELVAVADGLRAGIRQAQNDIQAFGAEVNSTLNEVAEQGHKLHDVFRDIFEAAIGGEIIKTFVDMAKATAAEQAALLRLEAAAGNTGAAVGAVSDKTVAWARGLARETGTSVNSIIDGVTKFKLANQSLAESQYLAQLATQVAIGSGRSYTEVVDEMVRALSGGGRGLREFGISAKNADGSLKTVKQMFAELAAKYSGMSSSTVTLTGQFEKLKETVEQFRSVMGEELAGILTRIVDGFIVAVEWIAKMPAGFKAILGIGVPLSAALLGIGLALPLVANGFIAVFSAEGLLAKGFLLLTGPIGLVMAALTAVGLAAYIVVNHWKQLQSAGSSALEGLKRAWSSFASFIAEGADNIGKIFEGIWLGITGHHAEALEKIKAGWRGLEAQAATVGTTIAKGFEKGWDGTKKGAASAWDFIRKEFLTSTEGLGKYKPAPNPNDLTTTGPGKDELATKLNASADAVQSAKDRLADLKAQADVLKASMSTLEATIGENGMTFAQYTAALRINRQEHANSIATTSALRAELAALKNEYAVAAAALAHYRATSNPSGANDAASKMRDLRQEMNGVTTAIAQQGAATAELDKKQRDVREAFRKQGVDRLVSEFATYKETAAKTYQDEIDWIGRVLATASLSFKERIDWINKLREAQRAQREEERAQAEAGRGAASEALRHSQAMQSAGIEQGGGSVSARTRDAQAVARAMLELDQATQRVKEAQDELAAAQGQGADAVAAASKKVTDATNAQTVAQDKLTEATAQQTNDTRTVFQQFGDAIRRAVPELNTFMDALKNGQSPMQAFAQAVLQAFEQTRAFQEITQMLGNLFAIVAQILNAVLLPVLNVLNRVLTFIVNVFIDLWNAVANLLRVLGIQVDTLKNITSLFGNLQDNIRPLIDVIHDLPTIQQMGSGQYGPLEPDQYAQTNLLGALVQNSASNATLSTAITALAALFAGQTISNWFSGLFSGSGGIGNAFGDLDTSLADTSDDAEQLSSTFDDTGSTVGDFGDGIDSLGGDFDDTDSALGDFGNSVDDLQSPLDDAGTWSDNFGSDISDLQSPLDGAGAWTDDFGTNISDLQSPLDNAGTWTDGFGQDVANLQTPFTNADGFASGLGTSLDNLQTPFSSTDQLATGLGQSIAAIQPPALQADSALTSFQTAINDLQTPLKDSDVWTNDFGSTIASLQTPYTSTNSQTNNFGATIASLQTPYGEAGDATDTFGQAVTDLGAPYGDASDWTTGFGSTMSGTFASLVSPVADFQDGVTQVGSAMSGALTPMQQFVQSLSQLAQILGGQGQPDMGNASFGSYADSGDGSGQPDMSNASFGSYANGSTGPTLSGGLSGALLGSTLGGLVTKLTGGNSTDASIGGAIGGGLAGAFLGPLGSLAGGALGGLIGGLFGPHETPAEQPDISATTTFGQDIANLQGTAGANGQSFTEQGNAVPSQVTSALQATGTLSMLTAIYDWIQQTGGTGLSAAQIAEFGPNSGYGPAGAGNLKQGNLTSGAAAGEYYSNFYADAQAALAAITSAVQSTASAAAGSISGAGGTRGAGGLTSAPTTVQQTVNINGDVNGMNELTDVSTGLAFDAATYANTRKYQWGTFGN